MRFYWRLCVLVAAVLATTIGGQFAVAAQDGVEELLKLYGTDQSRVDFVVVLDSSGSMKGVHAQVIGAIAEFVDSLPAGDYLSMISFDSEARYLLLPQLLTTNRSGLVSRIRGLAVPSGLYTDIGAAIEMTLNELSRPGANQLQFVFFITDGRHEPLAGSKYGTLSGQSWDDLRREASLMLSGHLVRVVALGLGEYTDIQLLNQVFGDVLPIVIDPQGLVSYFQRFRSELGIHKLRTSVAQDLSSLALSFRVDGRSVLLGAGESVDLRLYASATPVPLALRVRVDEVVLIGAPSDLRCQIIVDETVMQPGREPAPLTIRLSNTSARERLRLATTREHTVGMLVKYRVNAEPRAAIRELGLDPERREETQLPAITLGVSNGIPSLHVAIATGALVLILLFWHLRTPSLGGEMTVDGPDGSETYSLRRYGKAASLGYRCQINLPGGQISRRIGSVRAVRRGSIAGVRLVYTLDGKHHRLDLFSGGVGAVGEFTLSFHDSGYARVL